MQGITVSAVCIVKGTESREGRGIEAFWAQRGHAQAVRTKPSSANFSSKSILGLQRKPIIALRVLKSIEV